MKNINQKNKKIILTYLNFFVVFFVLLISVLIYKNSNASVLIDKKVLVVLKEDGRDQMKNITEIVDNNNGKISHKFGNKGFVLESQKELISILANSNSLLGIYSNKINNIENFKQDYHLMLNVWNKSFDQSTYIKEKDFKPVKNDALLVPNRKTKNNIGGPAESPYGTNFYDIAEFMAGKVSVGIILPESRGGYDVSSENWNSAREAQVISEIQSGMNWWYEQAKKRGIDISFTYNTYLGRENIKARTSYEPIRRTSFTGTAEQGLWINEIMNNFGYNSDDYFYNSLSFVNDMVVDDNSDWGFLIFVADSKNDADGKFADGKFAYSYYGGPFMMTTYDNDVYGINNMEAIIAHEMGHTFYALDQYYSARQDCNKKAGYLGITNQNSEYNSNGGSCSINESSIMRGGVYPYQQNKLDKYAAEQVGWKDDNSNDVIDILDVKPSISIIRQEENSKDSYTIEGRATVGRVENVNPYTDSVHNYYNVDPNDTTINTINNVWYKTNNSNWKVAKALDSKFDSGQEAFNFTVSGLNKENYNIDIKTEDSSGNTKIISTNALLSTPLIVAGAGPTGGPHVRIFNTSGGLRDSFFAYEEQVKSGVAVVSGDVDGDGEKEIITGPGNNAGPHVRIFKKDGTVKYPGFFAYEEHFRGGVNIALGDLDDDGVDEIIAGAGVGGGPHIRVFDYLGNQKITPGFFAYSENFRGGVNIATGDIDRDGIDEIIAGAGKGGGPQIRVFEGSGELKPIQFFAFHPNFRGGINVATGDFDGDGKDEIVASQASEGEAWVKVYRYNNNQDILGQFNAYGSGVEIGAHIAVSDIDLDGIAEIITGAGYGGGPQVRIFEGNGEIVNNGFFAYADYFRGGVYVGAE